MSTSDFRKRGYEGSDSENPAKRQKTLTKFEQQEVLLRVHAEELNQTLVDVKRALTVFSLLDGRTSLRLELLSETCDEIQFADHQRRSRQLEVLQDSFSLLEDDSLSGLRPTDQHLCAEYIEKTNLALTKVANLYKELLDSDTYPPSASNYAKPTIWPEWQQKPTAILNLRPGVNQGLPLSVLHPVFARFRVNLEEPLPSTTDASLALHAAFDLCAEMAKPFDDDVGRRNAFETSIKPLFAKYLFRHEVPVKSPKLERHSSMADFMVAHYFLHVLASEIKVECGTGDAYMHLSRVYQTWINHQKEEKAPEILHGAPMILICVMGPLFIVAGGFFDGKSVLVEPLTAPCLMLPDYHHQRQEQLARVLVATKEAVECIAQIDRMSKPTFEPGVPRIFPTFTGFEGQVIALTFKSRLVVRNKDPSPSLLFLASVATSSQQALVKLIADDRYGIETHRKLAEAKLAPILFGVAKVEGAHTAYVMEYLSPIDGWVTLHEYAKVHEDFWSRIQTPLEGLLETMDKEKIVHGDLRPNNIMVRDVEGRKQPQIKVIDFDWAGSSGTVKYPLRRNEGLPWPAAPGQPIVAGHDRTLLMACLTQKN